MLGLILLVVGIAGFGLGGYLDLRYTEFPDWLPYSMIILALVTRGVFSFIMNDFSILTNSILIGLGFLGFGLLLYYGRQWGDGDAWMLGALGFLFPDATGFAPVVESVIPFSMTMFFNFFMTSLFYLIFYAVVLGLRSPKVYETFIKNLRGNVRRIGSVFFALLTVSLLFTIYFGQLLSIPVYDFSGILSIPVLAVLILLFFQYAKAVESDLFKKKIQAKELKVGDVLIADRWRGLTEKEVERMKKKGRQVWIKEGVRFAPVFIISLIVTLFYGFLGGLLFPVL